MKQFLEKHYHWFVAGIIGFALTVSLFNAWNDSTTFDEVAHIPAGYTYVTEHDMRLNPEHPPLLKDLAGIPLLFLNLKFDVDQPFWKGELPTIWDAGQWAAGRYLLYQLGNNADQIVFFARLPIILISIALMLLIFFWAKQLWGTLAGLFALTLVAFDPNILGHNHYVTTDIGICAFLTFATYFFLKFIKKPTWKNVLLGGIFLGLVQLVKFSSITLFPVYGLVLILYPLFRAIPSLPDGTAPFRYRLKERLKLLFEYLFKAFISFAVSITLVYIVYWINTYNMPKDVLGRIIEFYFNSGDLNPNAHRSNVILHWLNHRDFFRPLSAYMLGIFMVFKRVAGGNGAYFLQQVSSTAFPLYFPAVFFIKETLPFLFLVVFSAGFGAWQVVINTLHTAQPFRKETWKRISTYLQQGVVAYTLFGFVVLYSYLSITGNLNIGFRHLFPILPFTYLLVTKKVFDFIHSRPEGHRKSSAAVAVFLALWIVTETIAAYPFYLSYFNQIAGGPHKGYRFVTDSNADWGQDLKRLNTWIKDYNSCGTGGDTKKSTIGWLDNCKLYKKFGHLGKMHIDYFGGGDIDYTIGAANYLHWWDSKRPVEPGWYAISVNFMMGSIYDKQKTNDNSYRWTQRFTPVAQAGTSMLIYHLTEEEARLANNQ